MTSTCRLWRVLLELCWFQCVCVFYLNYCTITNSTSIYNFIKRIKCITVCALPLPTSTGNVTALHYGNHSICHYANTVCIFPLLLLLVFMWKSCAHESICMHHAWPLDEFELCPSFIFIFHTTTTCSNSSFNVVPTNISTFRLFRISLFLSLSTPFCQQHCFISFNVRPTVQCTHARLNVALFSCAADRLTDSSTFDATKRPPVGFGLAHWPTDEHAFMRMHTPGHRSLRDEDHCLISGSSSRARDVVSSCIWAIVCVCVCVWPVIFRAGRMVTIMRFPLILFAVVDQNLCNSYE